MENSVKLPFDIKVHGEGRIITPEEKARALADSKPDNKLDGKFETDPPPGNG